MQLLIVLLCTAIIAFNAVLMPYADGLLEVLSHVLAIMVFFYVVSCTIFDMIEGR